MKRPNVNRNPRPARRVAAPRRGPEVIIRSWLSIDATGRRLRPVPRLQIFANTAGFRWLSEYFARWAKRRRSGFSMDDPAYTFVRGYDWPPFNPALGDPLEFEFGKLTRSNREAVIEYYSLSPKRQRLRDYRAICRERLRLLDRVMLEYTPGADKRTSRRRRTTGAAERRNRVRILIGAGGPPHEPRRERGFRRRGRAAKSQSDQRRRTRG